jgi:uncharacterized protein YdaU (DUF1376 family)
LHYYKRNIGDYHKKAGRLSILQHGIYCLLLDAIYDREVFPTKAEAIDWLWVSSEEEEQALDFVLMKFFVEVDGKYQQKRIARELKAYKANEESAMARKESERLRKQKYRERRSNLFESLAEQGITPDFNSTMDELEDLLSHGTGQGQDAESQGKSANGTAITKNHKPLTTNQEPIDKPKRFVFKQALLALGVSSDMADHWIAIRKKKKAVNSETALKLVINEAKKAGITPTQAINYSAENNWSGFKAEWYTKEQGQKYKTLSDIANDDNFDF